MYAAAEQKESPPRRTSCDVDASSKFAAIAGELNFTTLPDVLNRPAARDLVRRFLPEVGTSCLYGRPGGGKSFVVLDLLCRIAGGMPVWGQPALSGFTVYIATEGVSGLPKRVRAWLARHARKAEQIPMLLIEVPVRMREASAVTSLIERIQEVEIATGQRCRLICVDTLVQCLHGDENRQEDMSEFVAACNRLAHELQTHVSVVHHTGKRESDGPRGSSVIHGNFDTLFSVAPDEAANGTLLLTALKQKDERRSCVRLRLEVVEVGVDEDGDPVTTCLVSEASAEDFNDAAPDTDARMSNRLSPNEEKTLEALRTAGARGMTRAEWQDAARQAGVGPTRPATARECINAIIQAGMVLEADGVYFAF